MKVFERIMYPVLILLVAYYTYLSRTNPNYFEQEVAREGGGVQWAIILTLIFASLMCVYRSSILKPFRGSRFSFSLIIQGIIFFVFALDELSWGQIIIKFETPTKIAELNSLGAMNIRHLVIEGFAIKDIVFTLLIKIFATLYFLILPLLYARDKFKVKNFVNRFAIPLPRLTHTATYLIAALWMGVISSEHRYIIFELIFYWILVLMMYNPLNDEVFSRKSLVR